MSLPQYPLASTTWGPEEVSAMQEVSMSGKYTMGERVKEFENKFAEFLGTKHAVMVNSGSSANLAMLTAARFLQKPLLSPGDEVIVPAVSWSTTFYPVNQVGCKLSFVDIDLESLNIDPEKVLEAITPKTKAILAVNLLGNPCDLEELQKIAHDNDLVLFEDNCESLGATLEGKALGTFGKGGTYSTFFSHHISTMEGGLISTDDEEFYQVLKSIRAHGWTRDLPQENLVFNKVGNDWEDAFRFVLPGYNLRPLEIEAAIGLEQINKLSKFIDVRKSNAILFKAMMAEFSEIQIQIERGESSWFAFSMVLKGSLRGKRDSLVRILSDFNIESRPVVAGNFTRNPVIKHLDCRDLPDLNAANEVHDNGLFVGNHHFQLDEEIALLQKALTRFVREAKLK